MLCAPAAAAPAPAAPPPASGVKFDASLNHGLRLRWRDITGRRVGGDWTRSSMMPVQQAL